MGLRTAVWGAGSFVWILGFWFFDTHFGLGMGVISVLGSRLPTSTGNWDGDDFGTSILGMRGDESVPESLTSVAILRVGSRGHVPLEADVKGMCYSIRRGSWMRGLTFWPWGSGLVSNRLVSLCSGVDDPYNRRALRRMYE